MIYASKTPRDPEPYLNIETGKRYRTAPTGTDYYFRYDPRPEFDHAPLATQGPNPILVSFRANDMHPNPETWANDLTRGFLGSWHYVPAEQREHAYKVLTRLANLHILATPEETD